MNDLRKAAQQALEALEQCGLDDTHRNYALESAAITALRAALAEPVQEPVAYYTTDEEGSPSMLWMPDQLAEARTYCDDDIEPVPLYTAPQKRKPLSEEEIYRAVKCVDSLKAVEVARAIERAHGIGGSDD